jgi:DNA repair protein RecO
LTLLTREAGKLFAVAKGARKAASRLAGISDPLSSAVMDLAVGKRNLFVTQAQPLSSFRGLRTDFERLSFALALLELYAAVIPIEQPQPEAYDLLAASLGALERHEKPLVVLIWAQVALLTMEGFLPQFGRCVISDEPIQVAEPFVSPHAGGFVSETAALTFTDRFRVRAEVLYGLEKLSELDSPPPNLRFAEETLAALFPFWRNIAETALPANDSVVSEAVHGTRLS